MSDTFDGILVVDKPDGMTSHDVVASIRRRLPRGTKVGHTGTLDPFATGVLPIVVGRATRLSQWLTAGRKHYLAGIAFGSETDSGDRLGTTVAVAAPDALTALDASRVISTLATFVGTHAQVPPAHSAKKVDGERAYVLARRGDSVSLPPVDVTAHALAFEAWEPATHVATVSLDVSAGYYVRSLARDLGVALGVPAHLVSLRRTAAGAFDLQHALPLAALLAEPATMASHLVPMASALPDLPRVRLDDAQRLAIVHGRTVTLPAVDAVAPADVVRLLDTDGQLIALATARMCEGRVRLQPTVVLASPS